MGGSNKKGDGKNENGDRDEEKGESDPKDGERSNTGDEKNRATLTRKVILEFFCEIFRKVISSFKEVVGWEKLKGL